MTLLKNRLLIGSKLTDVLAAQARSGRTEPSGVGWKIEQFFQNPAQSHLRLLSLETMPHRRLELALCLGSTYALAEAISVPAEGSTGAA
jgi:hypothetical protein